MTRSALALPIVLALATGCGGYAEPAPPAPAAAADAGEAATPDREATAPDREATPDQEAATPDASPSDLAARVATIQIVPRASRSSGATPSPSAASFATWPGTWSRGLCGA